MILGTGTKGICSYYYKGEVGLGAFRHTRAFQWDWTKWAGQRIGLDRPIHGRR